MYADSYFLTLVGLSAPSVSLSQTIQCILYKPGCLINGSKPTQCNGRCSWLAGNHIIYYDGLYSLIIMIKIWLSLIKNSQKIIWFSYSFICIFCSLHSNLLPFWKPLEQRTAETLALQTLLSHPVIFHSVSPLVSLHPPIHPFISTSLFLSSVFFVALHPGEQKIRSGPT